MKFISVNLYYGLFTKFIALEESAFCTRSFIHSANISVWRRFTILFSQMFPSFVNLCRVYERAGISTGHVCSRNVHGLHNSFLYRQNVLTLLLLF